VRAPIGGVVLEQMVSTGESVPAAAPLYQIADLSALWVEVHVPVEQLEGIGTGSRALLPESGIEARIVTVGRLVHGEDQGVLVRAKVTDGAERLRPGQFVEVQLATATAAGERWRVPAAAVVRQGGATFVFVARDGGFEPVAVQLVAEEEGETVLSGPLTAPDRVVVAGVIELKAAWLGAAAAAEEAAAQSPPAPAADDGAAR
jgi:membrane fusion protein, heavy metal efflux system